MINLFKGHMDASDKCFVSFTKTKKEEHDDGKDVSKDKLIKLALNKHVIKNWDCEWKSPYEEEKHALTLRASLQDTKV